MRPFLQARGMGEFKMPSGSGAPVLVGAALDVLFQVHVGGVADAGVSDPPDDLEGRGQGFTICQGHGPVVEDVLGGAACADDGEGRASLRSRASSRLRGRAKDIGFTSWC